MSVRSFDFAINWRWDPVTAGDKRLDLKLTRAPVVNGKVVGPDGNLLSRVICPQLPFKGPKQSKDGTFSIEGLGADEVRNVLFLQHEKKLVAFKSHLTYSNFYG